MSTRIANLLDELDFFRDFSFPELEAISPCLMYLSAKAGDVVFREGDVGSYMLILVSGRIAITKGGERGSHLLSYEGKGRIIGEMALLDRERRSATCTAETDCELLSLSHDGLAQMAAGYPALAYRFMACLARLLSKRLRRTSGILAEYLVA